MSPLNKIRAALVASLRWLFRSTPIPKSFSRIADAGEEVVIVSQGDSLIIEALMRSLCARSGVAFSVYQPSTRGAESNPENPSILPSDIPTLPHRSIEPSSGSALLCSLHNHDGLTAILARNPDKLFSTLNIFHVRGPVRTSPSFRMGWLRKLGVLLGGKYLFIIFGEPQSLPQRTQRSSHSRPLERITRALKVDFYRNLRIIRGTPFQSQERQLRAVLSGKEVSRELDLIAQRTLGRSNGKDSLELAPMAAKTEPSSRQKQLLANERERLYSAARKEFYNIAANPRRVLYGIVAPICETVLNRLFRQIIIEGIEQIEQAVRDRAVVLVPMHRSHLDYILLSSQLYINNFNPPLVAAGINLAFWPMGAIFRSLGAYFVRRDSRHDRIHGLVLRRYVHYLTKRGHLQKFYLEGGRSRSGRMRPPKVGLLSIMLETWAKGDQHEIAFVPISITYESVIEEKAYGEENTGAGKVKENLASLLKVRSIFRKKYGEVVIKFGDPISPSTHSTRPSGESKEANGVELKRMVNIFALELSSRIRDQSHASLTGLVYAALLTAPRYGLSDRLLHANLKGLTELMEVGKLVNPLTGSCTPSLASYLSGNRALIDDLLVSGVLNRGIALGQPVYSLPGSKRYTADFYRNAVIHLFFEPALLSVLQLKSGTIELAEAARLREILSYDFLLPDSEKFAQQLARLCQVLTDRAILEPAQHPGQYKFRDPSAPTFIPAMLLSTLQSYLWVYENIAACPESTIEYEPFLDQLQESFKRGFYLGLVTRTEAGSRVALTTVLDALAHRRFISFELQRGKRSSFILTKEISEETALLRECERAVSRWLSSQESY